MPLRQVKQSLLKPIPVEYHGIAPVHFNGDTTWITIFRMPHVNAFRLIIRIKLYLTGASIGLCLFRLYEVLTVDINASLFQAGLLAVTTLSGLIFVGNYFRRMVCQIYISENQQCLRLCRFTFFGRRLDLVLPISCVVPLTETNKTGRAPVLTMEFIKPEKVDLVYDQLEFYDEKLQVPVFFGGIVDKERFQKALGSIMDMKPGA